LEGLGVTLKFTCISLLCGLPLGVALAIFKVSHSSILKAFASAYISIFRGIPLIVQLSLIFYGTSYLTEYNMSPFAAGIVTFSLNSAAYTSVIIFSGLQSIDKGQWEVAHVLGLSKFQTLRFIILPQAIRDTLPSLANEWIDLLKESALVSIIGEADLFRRAQIVASEKFLYFEPYLVVGLSYYVMVLIFATVAKHIEKNLRHA
jgi:His/Glu/Gln/Arg/opine family amino acid ABC transporter permease subunit